MDFNIPLDPYDLLSQQENNSYQVDSEYINTADANHEFKQLDEELDITSSFDTFFLLLTSPEFKSYPEAWDIVQSNFLATKDNSDLNPIKMYIYLLSEFSKK